MNDSVVLKFPVVAHHRLIVDMTGEEQRAADRPDVPSDGSSPAKSKSAEDGLAEWEEWNRRFQSLLG